MLRCVNIDWLEVYCIEPTQPRDAEYFRAHGYLVRERSYGTPNYREMFTIIDEGHNFIEVRRVPVSIKSCGGIAEEGACHIRLCNRTCYLRNPVQIMVEFLLAHEYQYRSVSRIDVCLDFQRFDDGTPPADFVAAFMRGDYQKINQCNIASHGRDGWQLRVWSSLKWGAPTSAITTKLYDKTVELKEVGDKPYIREVWDACGLTGDEHIWRVEFSTKSQLNCLVSDKEEQIITRSLDSFSSKDRQWFHFCVLANKYFHFKRREYTRTGQIKPKHRCADVKLFAFDGREQFYSPKKLTWAPEAGRTEKLLAKRLYQLARDKSLPVSIRQAAETLEIHMCDRYDILNYSQQLISSIEWLYSDFGSTKRTLELLQKIQSDYDLTDVKRPNLIRKLPYLII